MYKFNFYGSDLNNVSDTPEPTKTNQQVEQITGNFTPPKPKTKPPVLRKESESTENPKVEQIEQPNITETKPVVKTLTKETQECLGTVKTDISNKLLMTTDKVTTDNTLKAVKFINALMPTESTLNISEKPSLEDFANLKSVAGNFPTKMDTEITQLITENFTPQKPKSQPPTLSTEPENKIVTKQKSLVEPTPKSPISPISPISPTVKTAPKIPTSLPPPLPTTKKELTTNTVETKKIELPKETETKPQEKPVGKLNLNKLEVKVGTLNPNVKPENDHKVHNCVTKTEMPSIDNGGFGSSFTNDYEVTSQQQESTTSKKLIPKVGFKIDLTNKVPLKKVEQPKKSGLENSIFQKLEVKPEVKPEIKSEIPKVPSKPAPKIPTTKQ